MQKQMNFGTASLLVASVVLAVLFVVPDVGWMIRQQARILVGDTITPVTHPPHQQVYRVLREHPNDYALQLGGALSALGSESPTADDQFNDRNQQIVARLQALQEHFSSEPSLPAHILRFLCSQSLLKHREEQPRQAIPSYPAPSFPPPDSTSDMPPVSFETAPASLSSYTPNDIRTPELLEYVATRGEALDPKNAFFPTMRAIAYFAQERDAEARNALARAATKPCWEDYTSEENQVHLKLMNTAHGETGALQGFFIHISLVFPHYGQIRAMARVAVAQAAEMERKGKTEAALALRKAIARIGARLRDSSSVTGSLLGSAVTLISASRPGGAPPLSSQEAPDDEKRAAMNRDRYIAYLNRIGATEEARWYSEEWMRIKKVRDIYDRAMEKTNAGFNELSYLIHSWLIDVLLLVNAFWILLLGGVATLLARTRKIQEEQPLSRGMAWGFGYAILGPLLAQGIYVLVNILSLQSEGLVFFGIPILAGLLVLPFFLLKRGTDWRGYGRSIGGFLVAMATPLILILLFDLSLCGILRSEFYSSLGAPFYLIPNSPLYNTLAGTGLPLPLLPGILPLLCLIALAIRSWRRKVPVSVGIVRGFKRLSLPLASLLLIAYAFMVIYTLGVETEMNKSLQESTHHEGRYLSRLIGEEWPTHSDYRLPPIK